MLQIKKSVSSHPVGIDGQNHIIALPLNGELKFLPMKAFEEQQRSNKAIPLSLTSSMGKFKEVFKKKQKAKELKEKGNRAIQTMKYSDAERLYSEAIELNIGSRPLWTNRAACRNLMEKFVDAISDCDTALSIDPK